VNKIYSVLIKRLCFHLNHLLLGLNGIDVFDCQLSGMEALLLQSENLYLKMKIQQLEIDLENEKRRSSHFDGVSKIALYELQKGNWIKCVNRRERIGKVVRDFECEMKNFDVFHKNMMDCANKLHNLIRSLNALLQ
jgi:hypothetical protein